jgi:hypothetical protein
MLSEATIDETAMAMQQNPRQSEEDKRLLIQFSLKPWHDTTASQQEGRPIYREREYVTIMVPGDKDNVVCRPAREMDTRRFAAQYAAFKANRAQESVVGTPLRVMTFLTAAQVKELEYFNCHTVEQLAELPDSHAIKFMGIQQLKQLAKDFLKASREAAPLTAMRAELDEKQNQLDAALKAIEDQAKRLAVLEARLAEEE